MVQRKWSRLGGEFDLLEIGIKDKDAKCKCFDRGDIWKDFNKDCDRHYIIKIAENKI